MGQKLEEVAKISFEPSCQQGLKLRFFSIQTVPGVVLTTA
jgi:hypothetical protein